MAIGDTPTVTPGRRIEHDVRAQIENGNLHIGERLPSEAELSAQYGVGRNTVREALRALAGQGLLEIKVGKRGGTFVTRPSAEKISGSLRLALSLMAGTEVSVANLVQIREILEIPAAEIAALQRTEEELAALRATLFDPYHVDPDRVFGCTGGFHLAILRATHNPLLPIVASPVFQVLEERFLRDRAPQRVWLDVDRDHREIVDCLERHDQAGAREAMRAHLRAARQQYYQDMAES
ncbi:FadR family transcriptional regulator [Amycolatopsis sp. NBC_01488]|uniref:FadR/GntR family transcriptional regulator n=1 Tax=Amycolatopsis sp. NBC_01488 TaxID=2903563 RepID=UPI002E2C1EF6|nr:FadR/GntR family transcriptional regulator [Amycolatopsis sp. NBC_01488]